MKALETERCGIGIRGVAMGLDSVVWFGLFILAISAVGLATGQTETTATGTDTDLSGGPAALGLAFWLALAIGYHTLTEWRFGQTIGKYLVGIRAVSDDGTELSFGAALGRNVLRLVDWLPVFYVVGIVTIVRSDDQRIGDRLAGTAVIRA